MALIEPVSVPSLKSCATPGTGVSLCYFPFWLCLLFVCVFICLFLRSAFQPLAVVSLGSLPTMEQG